VADQLASASGAAVLDAPSLRALTLALSISVSPEGQL